MAKETVDKTERRIIIREGSQRERQTELSEGIIREGSQGESGREESASNFNQSLSDLLALSSHKFYIFHLVSNHTILTGISLSDLCFAKTTNYWLLSLLPITGYNMIYIIHNTVLLSYTYSLSVGPGLTLLESVHCSINH